LTLDASGASLSVFVGAAMHLLRASVPDAEQSLIVASQASINRYPETSWGKTIGDCTSIIVGLAIDRASSMNRCPHGRSVHRMVGDREDSTTNGTVP